MTEATITAELMNFMKNQERGVVIKHADKSTIGIPDISITGGGQTIWLEVKLVKYKKDRGFHLRDLVGFQGPQQRLVSLLDFHGSGAAYVFFFYNEMNRKWGVRILSGVSVVNMCNLDDIIVASSEGKQFEEIWQWVIKRRKKHDTGF